MKKIMILGASNLQVPLIKKLKELKIKSIVLDYNEDAEGFKYADKKYIVSTLDKEEALKIAEIENIDGILTTSDYPVRTVAYISQKLKLKSLTVEVAEICTDKYKTRNKLIELKMNYPKFIKINEEKDIYLKKQEFIYPMVMKPLDSSGSRGVIRITCFEDILNNFEETKKFSKDSSILLEEYIQGDEYSVECLIQNFKVHIISITKKYKFDEENFVEKGHIVPAKISKILKELIEKEVKKFIKNIGLNNSAAHVEIKINSENQIYIIEIGARLGGDFITSDLVLEATGINMTEQIIKICLGEKINIKKTRENYCGIRFLGAKEVEIYNEKNECKLVRKGMNNTENNSTEIKSSFDRIGYKILKCKKFEILEEELKLI